MMGTLESLSLCGKVYICVFIKWSYCPANHKIAWYNFPVWENFLWLTTWTTLCLALFKNTNQEPNLLLSVQENEQDCLYAFLSFKVTSLLDDISSFFSNKNSLPIFLPKQLAGIDISFLLCMSREKWPKQYVSRNLLSYLWKDH